MKCPNCGEELSDGVLFCRECGHKIQREPQKRFCRECGAKLEPNAKFCSTCGAKVLTEEDIIRESIVDVPPYDDDEDERRVQVVNVPHDKKPAKLGIKETIHTWWDRLDWITKACTIAGLFFLFALVIAWIAHKPLALIASVIQIALVCVTCGIHLNIIKTDKRWLSWVLPVIVLLMTSAYVEDFKPKNDAFHDSDITVETTVWETTTPETTEIVETTEYVLADDEVRIDFSKYDLMVENYEDVTYRLSNLGFTNISYRIQYDIVWGITKEGEVASVSIAGRTDYKKGDIFKADDPVVIAYHMKTDKDPSRETVATVASPIIETTSVENDSTLNTEAPAEDDVITIDNNDDFKALLTSDHLDATKQSQFTSKYKNRMIEFDCFIYYMEQDPRFETIWSYVFAPGESDNITGVALFGLESASFYAFKWDAKTRPSSLQVGSKIRMRAEVIGVNDLYIELKPVCTWGR